jgi:hypothetical protein
MAFRVGQKVVCITKFYPRSNESVTLPEKDKIYTIRAIDMILNRIGLRFEEIVNPALRYIDGVKEGAFDSKYFRPVDEQYLTSKDFNYIEERIDAPLILEPELV